VTEQLQACEDGPEKKAVVDLLNENNLNVIINHEYEVRKEN
jgi:hypothetical protein